MENSVLLEIANCYGTPTYVYDIEKIIEQYNKLNKAFDKIDLKIKYAMKALNNYHILKLIKEIGGGCDCVSIEEVHLAIRAGFEPSEIIFTPNGVDIEEIKNAVLIGVTINIDNLSILEEFGSLYGANVPVCLRLNPHILAGGNNKISVGHIDSKFGISIHQLKHILRITKHYQINVNGLHMHTGSEIIDTDVFIQGAELMYEAAFNFENLIFLNFGSGFKVAYKEKENVTNIEELGRKISKSFRKFSKEYGKELQLWFEPGKFLVSESGHFLVKANVIKQTTSTVFVGVNSGQNHLIRPMFYDAFHAIKNISNPKGKKKLYSVVGYICESDTFGFDRLLNEVSVSDILSIENAGAYCFTMSNNYNSRLKPAEVLYRNGDVKLIRKRETIEDLIRNEVID